MLSWERGASVSLYSDNFLLITGEKELSFPRKGAHRNLLLLRGSRRNRKAQVGQVGCVAGTKLGLSSAFLCLKINRPWLQPGWW